MNSKTYGQIYDGKKIVDNVFGKKQKHEAGNMC